MSFGRWYNELKRSRLPLRDVEKSGDPLTAVTERNVITVKNLIEKNRQIAYENIQPILHSTLQKLALMK